MVEFCVERGRVWVTYFRHISLHMYTRVAKGQDGVKVKSTIEEGEEGYAAICAGWLGSKMYG